MASLGFFDRESWLLSVLKGLVLTLSYALLLHRYTAPSVVAVGVFAFFVGTLMARGLTQSELTVRGALVVSISALGIILVVGEFLDRLPLLNGLLSASLMIQVVDSMTFTAFGLSMGFMLRFISLRSSFGGIGEIIFSVSSASTLLFEHRNHALDRPRFLADWAMIHGLNPYDLVLCAGIAAIVLTMFLSLRQRFARSIVLGIFLLSMVGALSFWLRDAVEIQSSIDDLLGGSDKGQGMGASDRLSNQDPPTPVAVALFHSEFESPDYVLHFRQQVLSFYDGVRYSVEPVESFDSDLIRNFPSESPIHRRDVSDTGYRTQVNTSMFLMTNHPQPFALSNAIEVAPRANPAPRRFVAAYDTTSSVLHVPIKRLLGRKSVPDDWSAAKREHYLKGPEDPRFKSLAQELRDEVDLKHYGDAIVMSLSVKRYLEKNAFYTLSEKHLGAKDPAASFLFGNLKGYCVHFAHSAVSLLRSLGVASRVALGYAVDLRNRGDGSALVIMGNTAHAWPEIHIEGIGWIPFDIYPERSDEPPPELVQQSLESILGEIAREDPIGQELKAELANRWRSHLKRFAAYLLTGFASILVFLYVFVCIRRYWLRRGSQTTQARFRFALDTLSDLGYRREKLETRDAFAQRMRGMVPSLAMLTHHFQAEIYGSRDKIDPKAYAQMMDAFVNELKMSIPIQRRFWGQLNPIGWLRTR